MRIEVQMTPGEFDDQTRAYAEFQVFSRLARFSATVEHARVSLKHPPAAPEDVMCAVDVTFSDRTRARVDARGGHAYSAINRAAERVSKLLRRHATVAMTS